MSTFSASARVLGGMLLVAGSCIGAGMLAMPILTGLAGYVPALIVSFLAWAFMTFTALILLEINSGFHKQVNIVSMAEKSLGNLGKISAWVLYLFLFYALLVGYVSISGSIVSSFIQSWFGLEIPLSASSLFFSLLFGVFIYFGTAAVDGCNRLLIVGLAITYILLVFIGADKINIAFLQESRWRYTLIAIPFLVTSFGFHNMIPSLTAYVGGDIKKCRTIILGGSLIALACYIVWETIVIGLLPFSGENGILQSYFSEIEAAQALKNKLGNSWVSNFAIGFSFFAIITSFLAQGLSLTHFLADGLKVKLGPKNNLWLLFLSLGPPCLLGTFYPGIFFTALGFAGGICAVLLFGILPALMAWKGRYLSPFDRDYQVKGGKFSLIVIFLFSLYVIAQELLKLLGVSFLYAY